MIKIFKYISFILLKILFYLFIYLFIGFLLLNLLLAITVYLTGFALFFFKYFIPIYFILSLYTVNYRGYYKLKFFGYNVELWKISFYNIIIFLKNLIYNYKFISLALFSIILIFNANYNEIYFLFIILFVLFFTILFYLYNNSYKFKIYLEKYFLWFNISIIIGIIYLLKINNFDSNIDPISETNYPNLIFKLSSPRWFFKSSFPHLYPEYKREIKFLKDGLDFNRFYLKDKYFLKFKNTNLDFDFMLIKKSIDKNLEFHKNFIKGFDLNIINYFKNIYIMDNFNTLNKLDKKDLINQSKMHDNLLFDLNSNKAYNCVKFQELRNGKVFFKDKNTYAKSFLKELGLSKNLLVNTNLVIGNFYQHVNVFNESNLMSGSLNRSINTYLNNIKINQNVGLVYDNILLNYLMNEYSEYLFHLKLASLNFSNSIDLLDDSSKDRNFYISLKEFKSSIIEDSIKNKYEIYANSIIYEPTIILNEALLENKNKSIIKEYIINEDLRVLDIELYIKYLNKYYIYLNKNSNLINWLNDLFILIFDEKKNKYNYWNEIMSLKDIEERDTFNLYRNFTSNFLYVYERELDISLYNEFKKSGTHYEDIVQPLGIAKAVLTNNDVKNFYYRFFNYSKDLEIFMNSYLWLSLEDSNIKLESFDSLLEYNEHLNEYKGILDNYIKKNIENTEFNLNDIKKYAKNHLRELMKIKFEDKNNKKILIEIDEVLQVLRILKLDFFIKNIIIDNNILLNYFMKKNNKYSNVYTHVNETDYIFFKKISDNNININILKDINDNLKIFKISNLKLSDTYKDFLFIGLYYDFINQNKDLFKVADNFDFLNFFYSEQTSLYMPIWELLDKMLVYNLNYYKNCLDNLIFLYTEIEKPLSTICNGVYQASDDLVFRMQKMLQILYEIDEKELYNNQPALLKKFKAITEEYSHFKDIFIEFKKIIKKINEFNNQIVNDKINEFNKLNKKIDSKDVIFFNNDNLLEYISENNIDLKKFEKSKEIIKQILDQHNEIINKLNLFNNLLDSKYIFVDHEPFYNEMCRCEFTIYENVNYYKLKRQYKYSTWEDSHALKLQIKRLDEVILQNNYSLDKGLEYTTDSLNKLKLIEKKLNDKFINDLQKINKIIEEK
jgi:hypothetical protein